LEQRRDGDELGSGRGAIESTPERERSLAFYEAKPGESLIIETVSGPLVIRRMAADQFAVVLPPDMEVIAPSPRQTWLPARPDLKHLKTA
jgi:hypothetical protein